MPLEQSHLQDKITSSLLHIYFFQTPLSYILTSLTLHFYLILPTFLLDYSVSPTFLLHFPFWPHFQFHFLIQLEF